MTYDAKTQPEQLSYAVLAYLNHGPEAVSYIHRNLLGDGWRGLGRLAEFENALRALGFTVRCGKNNRGQTRIEVDL